MKSPSDEYLFKCKDYFLRNIIPALSIQKQDSNFSEINELANEIVHSRGQDVFAGFLQEYHYLVQLWTAHLLILRSDISEELKAECILMIRHYTENPLAPEVAEEELLWLQKFYPNATNL